jgi:hypothetical protein
MSKDAMKRRIALIEAKILPPPLLHVITIQPGETWESAFDKYSSGARQRDPVSLPPGESWDSIKQRFLSGNHPEEFITIEVLPAVKPEGIKITRGPA